LFGNDFLDFLAENPSGEFQHELVLLQFQRFIRSSSRFFFPATFVPRTLVKNSIDLSNPLTPIPTYVNLACIFLTQIGRAVVVLIVLVGERLSFHKLFDVYTLKDYV
jgi:hypothetical protein